MLAGSYHSGMNFSLQQAVLLVLGGLIPAVAFVLTRAEYVALITLVNVLLIWVSLRLATGGSIGPVTPSTPEATEPQDT